MKTPFITAVVIALGICVLIFKGMDKTPSIDVGTESRRGNGLSMADIERGLKDPDSALPSKRSHMRVLQSESAGEVFNRVVESINSESYRDGARSKAAIFRMSVEDIDKLITHPDFKKLDFQKGVNAKLFKACFTRLAALDPEYAISYGDRLNPEECFYAVSSIFKQWLKDDEDRAVESMSQMSGDNLILAKVILNKHVDGE